jgi:ubiquinone biosynthesis monooxygenase Coq7
MIAVMALDDPCLIRRILRVNHAGEHAAISIYGAQIAVARVIAPDLLAWLEETRRHEIRHRRLFREAMPARDARPCHLPLLWAAGGAALGFATALLGRTGIMVCTAAVERTVHHHLNEQIAYLEQCDPELGRIIASVKVEEDQHLAHAEARHDPERALARAVGRFVVMTTDALIWLATRGDSIRLRCALAAEATA